LPIDLRHARIGILAGGEPHPHLVTPVIDRIHEALQGRSYDAVVVDLEGGSFIEELCRVDVGFVAHWGNVGDTGRVQGALELLGIPYTGSGPIASGVAKDKVKSKKLFRYEEIPTPDFVEIDLAADLELQAEAATAELGLPVVAKPVYEGGSYGIELCHSIAQLVEGLERGRRFGSMFAERLMPGRGFTVGILEDATSMSVLPAHEIVFQDDRPFLDAVTLFVPGTSWSVVPQDEDHALIEEMSGLARRAHAAVGAYGLSRTDFKLDAHGRPQVLEINPLPAMTDMSDLPFAAARAGLSFDDLVERILYTAVDRPADAR
jgi:D-alanine-D-alanine ligase